MGTTIFGWVGFPKRDPCPTLYYKQANIKPLLQLLQCTYFVQPYLTHVKLVDLPKFSEWHSKLTFTVKYQNVSFVLILKAIFL